MHDHCHKTTTFVPQVVPPDPFFEAAESETPAATRLLLPAESLERFGVGVCGMNHAADAIIVENDRNRSAATVVHE